MNGIISYYIERKEKYKDVLHQNDVWRGGKSLAKKINAVSILNYQVYDTGTLLSFFCKH